MTAISHPAARNGVDADHFLDRAAWLFTASVLLHNGDHVRRGADAVTADVFWAGSLSIGLEVAVVALVVARHRVAPLVAAVTGLSLAAGYVLVHALPGRGWLSDPLFDGGAETVSQLAATLEILAALALGAAGTLALRHHGGLTSAVATRSSATASPDRAARLGARSPGPPRPWRAVALHPVVLAMALGNAVILVLSLADR